MSGKLDTLILLIRMLRLLIVMLILLIFILMLLVLILVLLRTCIGKEGDALCVRHRLGLGREAGRRK